jgi:pimeloyl-ACP methyl ester carboxylesterase
MKSIHDGPGIRRPRGSLPALALLLPLMISCAHSMDEAPAPAPRSESAGGAARTTYRTVRVRGLDIFYREAGDRSAPAILLLHGFPSSSHMFRNLIPALADRFHVVAPDYPGFGLSSMPRVDQFEYTFDNLAGVIDEFTEKVGLTHYALYMQDYGAPIGFRLAVRHPERVRALVIQNGNAYLEGLPDSFWKPIKEYWRDRTADRAAQLARSLEPEATRWQYTHGARRPERVSPDAWQVDQVGLDRPGNKEIQLQLFYSYGSNPPLYPAWQAYLRRHQPPTLIVWGKNDAIFPAAGARAYQRDLEDAELHLLDTGHFALEEEGDTIARLMRRFLDARLARRE